MILESNHYPCFLAHDDVQPATDWQDEIWKALHASHAFVGLLTENFNSSPFCQQEMGAALALNKPRLLILAGTRAVPGFAARFQAVKKAEKLLDALNQLPQFRKLRVEAWIHATRAVDTFKNANGIYGRFRDEWDAMADDEKLRWLLAAASNRQVWDEEYSVGVFYKKARRDLKPLLTDQWLFENDKKGVLHDIDSNPVALTKLRT